MITRLQWQREKAWRHGRMGAAGPRTGTVGVYLIFAKRPDGRHLPIYIGEGRIRDRVRCHRRDRRITDFETLGRLMVAWAEVPKPLALPSFLARALAPGSYLAGSYMRRSMDLRRSLPGKGTLSPRGNHGLQARCSSQITEAPYYVQARGVMLSWRQ